MKSKLHKLLFKKIDSSSLALFRIFFGLIIIYQLLYYSNNDYCFQLISGPEFIFKYPYFEFLPVLDLGLLKMILFGMLVSSIFILFGWFYRKALIFLFLGFTYFSFIDVTIYNNHLYLFSLIMFVMIFVDADAKYCLKSPFSKQKKESKNFISNWNLLLLKFLIAITYFYGGIAKINEDWFTGGIPDGIINSFSESFVSSFLSKESIVNLVVYGGIAYDLGIVFLLINQKTRKLALVFVMIFNLMNGNVLFNDIGVFPYFMILATVLFFEPKSINKLVSKILPKKSEDYKKVKQTKAVEKLNEYIPEWDKKQKWIAGLLVGFIFLQLVLPFRYLAFTSNPEWTGHGSRFAWRMKMQTYEIDNFTMSFTNRQTGIPQDINYRSFLSSNQFNQMINDPFLIVQFSKYIHKKLKKQGRGDGIIKVNLSLIFNGRPAQLMIDPEVDLSRVDDSHFADYDWILPLKPLSD